MNWEKDSDKKGKIFEPNNSPILLHRRKTLKTQRYEAKEISQIWNTFVAVEGLVCQNIKDKTKFNETDTGVYQTIDRSTKATNAVLSDM